MGEEKSGGSESEVNELKVKVIINVNVILTPLTFSLLPPPTAFPISLPYPLPPSLHNKDNERVKGW